MDNLLKAYRFMRPDMIPVRFSIQPACWEAYGKNDLLDVIRRHAPLFDDMAAIERSAACPEIPAHQRKGSYTDSWGVRWEIHQNGLTGIVKEPPIPDWSAFERLTPPDAATQNGWGPQDWSAFAARVKALKAAGKCVQAGLRHGHCFLTLTYLRGFENVIYDMADEEPQLEQLIGMIQRFDLDFVERILSFPEVDVVGFPEDLGAQKGPLLSPDMFRTYIKPEYQAVMKPVKDAGKLVYMHSDGDIMTLLDDLLDCGVDIINLQDLVNGIDNIARYVKGRAAIDLDVDRQTVVPFGSPKDVDDLVREAVMKLYDPRGGLSLLHGLYPNVPLENVDALLGAFEKYRLYGG